MKTPKRALLAETTQIEMNPTRVGIIAATRMAIAVIHADPVTIVAVTVLATAPAIMAEATMVAVTGVDTTAAAHTEEDTDINERSVMRFSFFERSQIRYSSSNCT